MRVLIACEFSGIVRDAFIVRGHRADVNVDESRRFDALRAAVRRLT